MVASLIPPGAKVERYVPYGAAKELFRTFDSEVLYEGVADSGKTYADLQRVHWLCEKYPGVRVLFARQTMESLRESVLVTWEEKVLPRGHEALEAGGSRMTRRYYHYRNGSHVALCGLDKPEKTYSAEYDLIIVFEAKEVSLDAWEKLGRCMGRWNRLPFQQRVAETNPGPANHWLLQRMKDGKMKHLHAQFSDNPALTETALENLRNMTGSRRVQLFEGLWKSSEGQILPEWDEGVHMVSASDVRLPLRWHFAAVDWGHSDPGVFQVWGVDDVKRMFRVAEVYQTGKQLDWWAEVAIALHTEFDLFAIVCDPSRPENIITLNDRLGPMRGRALSRLARPADNDRMTGIDQMRWALTRDNGGPRAFFVRNALRYGVDQSLLEMRRPTCTETEVDGWVWREMNDGRAIKEEPDKRCADHGLDCFRYACKFLWGRDPIEVKKPEFAPGTYGHEDHELFGEARPE